ncbi:MAG: RNA polymerase sigma-54 factor [Planctomycetota bacterium]|nr:MAG: RNA polymerase sigma-54 factor [Planctomycetota bacterium]
MRLEYQQSLRMEQRLLQSPQMIQAMQILQLTTPELLDRIEAELEDNPFLETGAEAAEEEAPAPAAAAAEEERRGEAEEAAEERAEEGGEDLPGIGEVTRLVESERGAPRAREGEDGVYDPVGSLAAPDVRTADSVLAELRMAEASPQELDYAELLLVSLDHRGFLPEGVEALAEEAGVPADDLRAVLQRLRALAHPALAARDLQECFLLQLQAMPERHLVAETIVSAHYEDLLANRLPQIAKALELPLEHVRVAVELLGSLDARPLGEYEADHTLRILPDVVVQPAPETGYEVQLARDGLPELRLSASAREALDKARGDKRLYEFLLKKIERARWFLDALEQRRQTLRRISRALVDRQREFLEYGPERLAPLKMQEIADALGIHISTVSRAIRGKYAQTPQGILPLKGFFSGGQRTSSGGERSRVSIQKRIQDIIEAEDKSAPLSDEEVVRILRDRDGVKVARRTVTKYRIALSIPPSHLRRSY